MDNIDANLLKAISEIQKTIHHSLVDYIQKIITDLTIHLTNQINILEKNILKEISNDKKNQ